MRSQTVFKVGDRVRCSWVLPNGQQVYPEKPLATVIGVRDVFGPLVKVKLDAPTTSYDGHLIGSTIEASPHHFFLELTN